MILRWKNVCYGIQAGEDGLRVSGAERLHYSGMPEMDFFGS